MIAIVVRGSVETGLTLAKEPLMHGHFDKLSCESALARVTEKARTKVFAYNTCDGTSKGKCYVPPPEYVTPRHMQTELWQVKRPPISLSR